MGEAPGGPATNIKGENVNIVVVALAWVAVSVPVAVAVGRWLRHLDCCDHPEAG